MRMSIVTAALYSTLTKFMILSRILVTRQEINSLPISRSCLFDKLFTIAITVIHK
jgi:hypothetical protein